MAQQELSCRSCDTRFPSQASCPSCGVPSTIASAEERVLWEMGQWEAAEAVAAPQPLRLAAVGASGAGAADVRAADARGSEVRAAMPAPKSETTKTKAKAKPFSPVPIPRKKDGGNGPVRSGSMRREPARPRASEPAAIPATDEPSEASIEAVTDVGTVGTSTVPMVEAAAPTEAPARTVARGSIVRRAGEQPPDHEPDQAPVAEVTYRSAKRESKRRARYERKIERLMQRLGGVEGEVVMNHLDGTLGIRPATLVLTNFRIAVVPHRKRWSPRWIPLEEVTKISGRSGSSNLIVDASVEVLRFGSRRAHRLHELTDQLRGEVKEARTGRSTGRHNASLVQMWCDRTSAIWDSPWGRLRLWLDHHPRARLVMFAPAAPIGYLIVRLF